MSCHGCANSFGFLKREYGCPKCGFSYCKKCLKFKVTNPEDKKQMVVCHRCNEVMASGSVMEGPPTITNALQKLESLDNPSRPPITVYKQSSREVRLAQLKRGLSEEDKQIADRLESLRRHDKGGEHGNGHRRRSDPIEEIEERLARLKDEDPELLKAVKNASASVQFKSKPETEADLISKFTDEVKLDNQYQAGFSEAVSDIEMRLAKLRSNANIAADAEKSDTGMTATPKKSLESEEDEEEQVARMIAKFKAEMELDSTKQSADDSNPAECEDIDMSQSGSNDEEDDDNLCRICDEKKAVLKCEECDGDLFCKKCFQELHRELGEMHKPSPFKK